jgi:hypothetical protein
MSRHRLVWETGGILLAMAGALITRTIEVFSTLGTLDVQDPHMRWEVPERSPAHPRLMLELPAIQGLPAILAKQDFIVLLRSWVARHLPGRVQDET